MEKAQKEEVAKSEVWGSKVEKKIAKPKSWNWKCELKRRKKKKNRMSVYVNSVCVLMIIICDFTYFKNFKKRSSA